MKRLIFTLLALAVLLCGCFSQTSQQDRLESEVSVPSEQSGEANYSEDNTDNSLASKIDPEPTQAPPPTLCTYLPVSSLSEGAQPVLESYADSIAALDYLVLNTGAYWDESGALSLSDELLDAIDCLSGKVSLWCTVNPSGELIRSQTAGSTIDTPQEREALAQNIAAFAQQYQLSGIDIDWEFPLEDEWEDFSSLIVALHQTLSALDEPVKLYLALYPEDIFLSEEAIRALESIHVMAYDQFDAQGYHSTFQTACDSVAYFLSLGAKPQQLVLGIPAYGRPLDGSAQWIFYKDIDPSTISGENPDLAGTIYFNSPATTQQKTEYACQQQLGGVMVYQLLCDRRDENALILACANTLERLDEPSNFRYDE